MALPGYSTNRKLLALAKACQSVTEPQKEDLFRRLLEGAVTLWQSI